MVIIVHSETNAALIERNLGESEYSYYFVLEAFRPVLQKLGRVITVSDPGREVDLIHRRASQSGEDCIFLSFSPPHRTPYDLACPTIPVFAWEYDTLPSETWYGERHQDWRFVLDELGRAITHSNFSVNAVRSALGPDFPVASIPAPIFDRFKSVRSKSVMRPVATRHRLSISGRLVDSRTLDLSADVPPGLRSGAVLPSRTESRSSQRVSLELDGVIYATVLNPHDERKNCFDLLAGFCWAFREIEDATLIIKLSHHDPEISEMMKHLRKLSPFNCRVVLIGGYLSDHDYENLLLATTYAVNTSQGEGECIPLMEAMSVGKPTIAPCHTGMIDYLSPANAFLVASSVQPATWPQDPRGAYRAFSHRIDFESLLNAFAESYRVAREQPQRYEAMAEAAKKTLEQYNSDAVTLERLRSFLALSPRPVKAPNAYGQIPPPHDAYSLGDLVDFANEFTARRYLGPGWGATEFALGVWSNGPLAELCFRLERPSPGPLRLRINLTAFVVKEHPDITVNISADDFDLAQWRLSLGRPELIHGSWHEAVIPPEVTRHNAFSIRLKIDHPAAPKNLGLSGDVRLLGILLHRLSLSLDAGTPPEPATS
jgi:glycosyltransferase involved in cell wall biosynthesis